MSRCQRRVAKTSRSGFVVKIFLDFYQIWLIQIPSIIAFVSNKSFDTVKNR